MSKDKVKELSLLFRNNQKLILIGHYYGSFATLMFWVCTPRYLPRKQVQGYQFNTFYERYQQHCVYNE